MDIKLLNKFLLCYFVIKLNCGGVKSLDLYENEDDVEILKHLFGKLNKLLEGNDLLQKDLDNIKSRIEILEGKLNEIPTALKTSSLHNPSDEASHCHCPSTETADNYCFGNRWIVIQRRTDGSENFNRDWHDYKLGFGNKSNEFFMGLEEIHQITIKQPHELLIKLEDCNKSMRYAKYSQFEIASEEEGYALKTLGAYSGNAGDSLTYHLGMKFSTKDRDNDQHKLSCARVLQSAWWFKACSESNLNGCYADASSRVEANMVCDIHWKTFHGLGYSFKFVEMMIRTKNQV